MKPDEPAVMIEECEAEVQVTTEALNRTLELLARWALRHRQKVLGRAGVDPENRVTGGDIKGYGCKNGSN